jgi:uncharacterized protein YjiS (DUF1127 family)
MAITSIARPATSNNALGSLIDGLRARIERTRVYHRTLAELNALNDRELADIGVSRLELREIARDAAQAA